MTHLSRKYKYALDENFHDHFCPRRKAAKFCHPVPNYLSSCLPVQSLEIFSRCLFPGLVWPHLVQLTKAELLYSSATATPRENNQDHLSVGWVAFRTQLWIFNVLVPVTHHKIYTTLTAGGL